MTNTRRKKADTAAGAVDTFQRSVKPVEPPSGVILAGDDERALWDQYTRARSSDSWRDCDLLMLGKMVKIECDIRRYQAQLDLEDAVIMNARGFPVENPLFRVVDSLQKRQLSIIRALGLNQSGKDPRTMNANAKREKAAAEIVERIGSDSLLAAPMH